MGKIVFIISLLFSTILFSQDKKIVVEFSKNDSIKILKENKSIYIYIYYEKNIEYNKSKEKRPLVDGRVLCKGCKKEFDVIFVSRPKKKLKNIRIISAKEWKEKGYLHQLEYIKVNNFYYKYIGDIIP